MFYINSIYLKGKEKPIEFFSDDGYPDEYFNFYDAHKDEIEDVDCDKYPWDGTWQDFLKNRKKNFY